MEETGRLHSMESQRVRRLSDFHFHFFLPRSNCLLNSWLQSLSAVMLELEKKSVTASSISPYICHKVMGGVGGQEEKGTTENEMAGWHHQLDGRESE